MKYLLLIYDDEIEGARRYEADPEYAGKEMAAYMAFSDELIAAGKENVGEALHPTSTATTVRVREGKKLTTHGPFAETKEQLGGYYVVEAADLDEAIQWAAKIPNAQTGAVEVRPIVDFSEFM